MALLGCQQRCSPGPRAHEIERVSSVGVEEFHRANKQSCAADQQRCGGQPALKDHTHC